MAETPNPDDWPVDVLRTDESGDVDIAQVEHNLSLTVEQRLEQHYQFRKLAEIMRAEARRRYGSAVDVAEKIGRFWC